MRRIWIAIFLFFLVCAETRANEARWAAMLAGFDAGLGGAVITNEYKDMHGNATFLPLLGHEGEYLYLRGVSAGVHFFKNDWLELNGQLSYLPQHFYAEDSDDRAIRRLENRYSSLMGGFNGRLITPAGIVGLTISTDLLGYNNGILADASYTLPLGGGSLSVAPTVGVQWTDSNYNRYYYGVDHSEARKSGLEYYDPQSSFSPYAQLSARYNLTEKWSVFGSARALLLNQEISDSPMVDTSGKFSFSLGAMYDF